MFRRSTLSISERFANFLTEPRKRVDRLGKYDAVDPSVWPRRVEGIEGVKENLLEILPDRVSTCTG